MSYNVIVIEREFATGGLEVGEKLAEKLNIPCYSKEILDRAAEKMNMSPSELKDLEESMTGNLLFSLNMLANLTKGFNPGLTEEQRLALVESEIVREISLNPCVIVGRGAAGLLKDRENVMKIFIHANLKFRKERAVNVYNVDPSLVETTLRKFDKRRSNYFKAVTGIEWKSPKNYHMILNSEMLGIDNIVNLLYATVKNI
ncbi:Cytidylate kinase [Anaerosphaera aminiphila DSM 21120]|uniref:Cytidylate kinase n=1 Tax=Anaerosphaera aminiphila DSM 21120 TaxID=1120995 RepID=A0A1M5PBF9_9FIRM|nr:cytidylate kinase-like family protein [Anaerosphaera aminiphila]SHG99025.1 Cytidylate kinase [Anaerosphaera aminiphila DSM 21120]